VGGARRSRGLDGPATRTLALDHAQDGTGVPRKGGRRGGGPGATRGERGAAQRAEGQEAAALSDARFEFRQRADGLFLSGVRPEQHRARLAGRRRPARAVGRGCGPWARGGRAVFRRYHPEHGWRGLAQPPGFQVRDRRHGRPERGGAEPYAGHGRRPARPPVHPTRHPRERGPGAAERDARLRGALPSPAAERPRPALLHASAEGHQLQMSDRSVQPAPHRPLQRGGAERARARGSDGNVVRPSGERARRSRSGADRTGRGHRPPGFGHVPGRSTPHRLRGVSIRTGLPPDPFGHRRRGGGPTDEPRGGGPAQQMDVGRPHHADVRLRADRSRGALSADRPPSRAPSITASRGSPSADRGTPRAGPTRGSGASSPNPACASNCCRTVFCCSTPRTTPPRGAAMPRATSGSAPSRTRPHATSRSSTGRASRASSARASATARRRPSIGAPEKASNGRRRRGRRAPSAISTPSPSRRSARPCARIAWSARRSRISSRPWRPFSRW